MDGWRQTVQWIGVLLFAGSAFLPAFGSRVGTPGLPAHAQPGPRRVVLVGPPAPVQTPAEDLSRGISDWASGGSFAETLWTHRANYPYLLAPIWLLALLIGRARPRLAGGILAAVILVVIVIEFNYLFTDYLAFLPEPFVKIETAIVWLFVVTVLLWRPPAARWLAHPGGHIAGMAMLGLLHALTLPPTMVRDIVASRGLGEGVDRVLAHFGAGFWLGVLGLLLASAPLYLQRWRRPRQR